MSTRRDQVQGVCDEGNTRRGNQEHLTCPARRGDPGLHIARASLHRVDEPVAACQQAPRLELPAAEQELIMNRIRRRQERSR